ncbi:MAG: endonuclease III, partial [Holosporaceae bacterium]|nr:endonuclease III [Holosporaceae bacterium]
MNAGVVEEICCRLAESFPAPKTELEYDSHYMFLVAVVLSAQTTDAQVNRAVSKLFRNCQTPSEIIRLGLERLQESIKSIGLYR